MIVAAGFFLLWLVSRKRTDQIAKNPLYSGETAGANGTLPPIDNSRPSYWDYWSTPPYSGNAPPTL